MPSAEFHSVLPDPEHDGLPPADWTPPTPAQIEFEARVAHIGDDLERCSRYPADLWHYLSPAADSLNRLARSSAASERLAPVQRDRLLRSVAEAGLAVREHVPQQGTELVAAGMDALFVLANHLAETDAERAARHPDVVRNALDYARVLANVAWSICLLRDVAGRSERRRSDTVAAIIHDALAHVPQFRRAA